MIKLIKIVVSVHVLIQTISSCWTWFSDAVFSEVEGDGVIGTGVTGGVAWNISAVFQVKICMGIICDQLDVIDYKCCCKDPHGRP